MREIKFRVWSIQKKEGKMLFLCPGDTSFSGTDLIETENWKVMQYTGLTDKNGKEIYEGDIVKWSDGDYKDPSNPRIGEVRFDPELCFFGFNVNGGYRFGLSNFIYKDTEKYIEVIGNIYENLNY